MTYWKYGVKKVKRTKKLSTTGRVRRVGVRNTTDKATSKINKAKRVEGWVNHPDTSKSGRKTKNFRRESSYY